MKNSISTFLLLFLTISVFSQVREIRIYCSVMPTYKRSILKEKISSAKTMSDLNPGYPSSWINRHLSADLEVTCNGKTLKASSPNDTLTTEQKSLLARADLGTDILINVKYNPRNSLYDEKVVREIEFAYTVTPPIEAKYPKGEEELKQYLKERSVDKIPKDVYDQLENATVTFTINKYGQVTNAHVTEPSNVENIDELMLKVICNMPDWIPAENSKGEKVEQEFRFSLGYMIGC